VPVSVLGRRSISEYPPSQRPAIVHHHRLSLSPDCGIQDQPFAFLHRLRATFPHSAWTALAQLLQRPWYSRVWVIQEVVIAAEATLICGRHRIPFDAMITALPTVVRNPIEIGFNVESYGGDNPDGYSLLMEMGLQRIYFHHGGASKLQYLLTRTGRCGATDPRDKTFAVLGIFKDAEDIRLKPDYALSAAEVYRNLAIRQLSGTNPL